MTSMIATPEMRKKALEREIRTINEEKDQYNKALNYAEKLKNYLSESYKYLDKSNDYMKKYFVIGGNTADSGKIMNSASEIQKIIKKIDNEVITNINSQIKSLNLKYVLKKDELRRLQDSQSRVV